MSENTRTVFINGMWVTGSDPWVGSGGGGGGKGSYPHGNGNGTFQEGGGGPNGDGSGDGEAVNGVFQSSAAPSPSVVEVSEEMILAALKAYDEVVMKPAWIEYPYARMRAALVAALRVR